MLDKPDQQSATTNEHVIEGRIRKSETVPEETWSDESWNVRSEILNVLKMSAVVFWVVVPCSRRCLPDYQQTEKQDHTTLQPRNPPSAWSSMFNVLVWKTISVKSRHWKIKLIFNNGNFPPYCCSFQRRSISWAEVRQGAPTPRSQSSVARYVTSAAGEDIVTYCFSMQNKIPRTISD